MSAVSNHVAVSVSQSAVRVSRDEFGKPLLISYNLSFPGLTKEYFDEAELLTDGLTTDHPEYLWAQAFFGQEESLPSFVVGKGILPPTQAYTLVPVVQDNHVYSYDVQGPGITAETVSYTSDASASLAEIIGGLETAFNAVVGKNFTAVDTASTSLIITGDAAGNWFSIKPNDLVNNDIAQTHADPGIATDLTAINNSNGDWYTLQTMYNSNAMVLAADAWAASQTRLYIFDVNETAAANTAAGNSDTLDDIATLTRGRTAGVFHSNPAAMNVARWCGSRLSKAPGSSTWAATQLEGIAPDTLTPAQKQNLWARNASFYELVKGLNIMSFGTTADGDFIDVQRFIDWQEDDIASSVFGALVAADKIAFEDPDLIAVEAEITGSLQRGVDSGGLASNPAPSVSIPKVVDVSTANKLARTLAGVKGSATLAGAVHKVNISVNIAP